MADPRAPVVTNAEFGEEAARVSLGAVLVAFKTPGAAGNAYTIHFEAPPTGSPGRAPAITVAGTRITVEVGAAGLSAAELVALWNSPTNPLGQQHVPDFATASYTGPAGQEAVKHSLAAWQTSFPEGARFAGGADAVLDTEVVFNLTDPTRHDLDASGQLELDGAVAPDATFRVTAGAAHGTFEIDGSGRWSYRLDAARAEFTADASDTVTVEVVAADGGRASIDIQIAIAVAESAMTVSDAGARASVTIEEAGLKIEAVESGVAANDWVIGFLQFLVPHNPYVHEPNPRAFTVIGEAWTPVSMRDLITRSTSLIKATIIEAKAEPAGGWSEAQWPTGGGNSNVGFEGGAAEADLSVAEDSDMRAAGLIEVAGNLGEFRFSGGTANANGSQQSFTGDYGTLVLDADGDWVYTLADATDSTRYAAVQSLDDGETETDAFTVTVTDSGRDGVAGNADDREARHRIEIAVAGLNDAPEARAFTIVMNEEATHILSKADFGYSDADGDELAYIVIRSLLDNELNARTSIGLQGPLERHHGTGRLTLDGVDVTVDQKITLAMLDAGRLIYTPQNKTRNYNDQFTFAVNDGTATSADRTATFSVRVDNDAPVIDGATGGRVPDITWRYGEANPTGDFHGLDPDIEHGEGNHPSGVELWHLAYALQGRDGTTVVAGRDHKTDSVRSEVTPRESADAQKPWHISKDGLNWGKFLFHHYDVPTDQQRGSSDGRWEFVASAAARQALAAGQSEVLSLTVTISDRQLRGERSTEYDFDLTIASDKTPLDVTNGAARPSAEYNGIKFELLEAGHQEIPWEIRFAFQIPPFAGVRFEDSLIWTDSHPSRWTFTINADGDWSPGRIATWLTSGYGNVVETTTIGSPATPAGGWKRGHWENLVFRNGSDAADLTVTAGDRGDATAKGRFATAGQIGAVSIKGDVSDSKISVNSLQNQYTFVGTFGSLVLDTDGDWLYTINPDAPKLAEIGSRDSRFDTFTIIFTDNLGTAVPTDDIITHYSLSITVRGANQKPTAAFSITGSIDEERGHVFAEENFGFTDPDGNALDHVEIVTLPSYTPPAAHPRSAGSGRLTLNGEAVSAGDKITLADIEAGHLVYRPMNKVQAYTDTFTFKVSDGRDASDVVTGLLPVAAGNDAPRIEGGDISLSWMPGQANPSGTFSVSDPDVEHGYGQHPSNPATDLLPPGFSIAGRNGFEVETPETGGVVSGRRQWVVEKDGEVWGRLWINEQTNRGSDGTWQFIVDQTWLERTFAVFDGTIHTRAIDLTVNVHDRHGGYGSSTELTSGINFSLTVANSPSFNDLNIITTAGSSSDLDSVADKTVTEDSADTTASGHIYVDVAGVKVDHPVMFFALNGAGTGRYGTLTLNRDGDWTYQINNNLDVFDRLDVGDTATDTFSFTATYHYWVGHRAEGVKGFRHRDGRLHINVEGANEKPTASFTAQRIGEEDPFRIKLSHFDYSDVENNPLVSVTIAELPSNDDTGTSQGAGRFELNQQTVTPNTVVSEADIRAGRLVYIPVNKEEAYTDRFAFKVSDQHGTGEVQYGEITVLADNDAPTIGDGTVADISWTVGQPATTGSFEGRDPDIEQGETAGLSMPRYKVGSGDGTTATSGGRNAGMQEWIISVGVRDWGSLWINDLTGGSNGDWRFVGKDSTIDANLKAGETKQLPVTLTILDRYNGVNSPDEQRTTYDLNIIIADSHSAPMVANLGARASATINKIKFEALASGTDANSWTISFSGGALTDDVHFLSNDFSVSISSIWSAANILSLFNLDGATDGEATATAIAAAPAPGGTWDRGDWTNPDPNTDSWSFAGGTAEADLTVTEDTDGRAAGWLVVNGGSGNHRFSGGTPTTNGSQQTFAGDYGTLTLDSDGDWVYELTHSHRDVQGLAAGGELHDSFDITVTDFGRDNRLGGANDTVLTETIRITIRGSNENPTASFSPARDVVEETPYAITAAEFGFSDTDGGSLAGVTIVEAPTIGELTVNGSPVNTEAGGVEVSRAVIDAGGLKYVAANRHEDYDATFRFTVSDGTDVSDEYTATLSVDADNDAPAVSGIGDITWVVGQPNRQGVLDIVDPENGADWKTRVIIEGRGGLTVEGGAHQAGRKSWTVKEGTKVWGKFWLDDVAGGTDAGASAGRWEFVADDAAVAALRARESMRLDLTVTAHDRASTNEQSGSHDFSITIADTVGALSVINSGARAAVTKVDNGEMTLEIHGLKFEAVETGAAIDQPWTLKFKNADAGEAAGVDVARQPGGGATFTFNLTDIRVTAANLRDIFNADVEASAIAKATIITAVAPPGGSWDRLDWTDLTPEGSPLVFEGATATADLRVTEARPDDSTAGGQLQIEGLVANIRFRGDTSEEGISVNANGSQYSFDGEYGTLKLDIDGDWRYTVDDSAEVRALGADEVRQDSFTVEAVFFGRDGVPGSGDDVTAEHEITVNVHGINRAPVLNQVGSIKYVHEESHGLRHSYGLGDFTFTDEDGDELQSITIESISPAPGTETVLELNGRAVAAGDIATRQDLIDGDLVLVVEDRLDDVVFSFTFTASDGTASSNTRLQHLFFRGFNDAPAIVGGVDDISWMVGEANPTGDFEGIDDDFTHGEGSINLPGYTLGGRGGLTVSAGPTANGRKAWIISEGGVEWGRFHIDAAAGGGSDGTWEFVGSSAGLDTLEPRGTKTLALTMTINDRALSFVKSTSYDFTIAITAANNAPVISSVGNGAGNTIRDTISTTETYDPVTGRFTATDLDPDDTAFTWSVAGAVADSTTRPGFSHKAEQTYGTLFYAAAGTNAGAWEFVVDSTAVNALGYDATGRASFAVTASDGADDSAPMDLVFDFIGSEENARPTINPPAGSAIADTAAADTFADITGTFTGGDREIPRVTFGVEGAVAETVDPEYTHRVDSDYGSLYFHITGGNWKFVVDAAAVDALGAADAPEARFQVTSSDGIDQSAPADLVISIAGANDTPQLASVAGGAIDGSASTIATPTGTFSASDRDSGHGPEDLSFHVAGALADASVGDFTHRADSAFYGSLRYNTDTGAWRFDADENGVRSVGEGQEHTVAFSVTAFDGLAHSAAGRLGIEITGANHAPTLVHATGGGAGAVTEDGSDAPAGSLSFDDANVNNPPGSLVIRYRTATSTDTNPPSPNPAPPGTPASLGESDFTIGGTPVPANGAFGSFTLSRDNAARTLEWSYAHGATGPQNDRIQALDDGDEVHDVLFLEVYDGAEASAVRSVTVTIAGANDAPTVSATAVDASVTEDSDNAARGTLSASDVDSGDSTSYRGRKNGTADAWTDGDDAANGGRGAAILGEYGTLYLKQDNTWSYELATDTATAQGRMADGLDHDDREVDRFEIIASDGTQNSATPAAIAITVQGANDVPTVTATATDGTVTEDDTSDGTASGTLSHQDSDTGDTATYKARKGGTSDAWVDGDNTANGGKGEAVLGNYGTLYLKNDNTWSYELATDTATAEGRAANALDTDDVATETFEVVANDGTADSIDPATISITVGGANDAPVLDPIAGHAITDTTGLDRFDDLTGTFTASDPDDAPVFGVAGATALTSPDADGHTHRADSSFGTLFFSDSTGAWRFDIDDDAVNALPGSIKPGTPAVRTVAFEVTADDGEATSATERLEFRITGSDENAPPSVSRATQIAFDKGEWMVLGTRHIHAEDADTGDAALTYTITALDGATLQRKAEGQTDWTPLGIARNINTFTQADIDADLIRLTATADGSFTVALSDSHTTLEPQKIDFKVRVEHKFKGTTTPGADLDVTSAGIPAEDRDEPRSVKTGLGKNSIKTGNGNDKVDTGRDDDETDLSLGGEDQVVYRYRQADNGGLIAWDGGDTVTGFKPGEDKLMLAVSAAAAADPDAAIADFTARLGTGFRVRLDAELSDRGTGTSRSDYDIAGIDMFFSHALVMTGGRLSGAKLSIGFDDGIAWDEFDREWLAGATLDGLMLGEDAAGRAALGRILGLGAVADTSRATAVGTSGEDDISLVAVSVDGVGGASGASGASDAVGQWVVYGAEGNDDISLSPSATEEVVYRLADDGTGVTTVDGRDLVVGFERGVDRLTFLDTEGEAASLDALLGRLTGVALLHDGTGFSGAVFRVGGVAVTLTVTFSDTLGAGDLKLALGGIDDATLDSLFQDGTAPDMSGSEDLSAVGLTYVDDLFGGADYIGVDDTLPSELL